MPRAPDAALLRIRPDDVLAALHPLLEVSPMTSPSRTTVVVITRDRRDQLLHTLDRLAALPGRPPVIVVDNGSTDGTPDAVARRHPDVTLLLPGRNLGAVGRTLGARRAATPYVAFSDDDSWWEPGALGRAERLLDAHPRLGLLAARASGRATAGRDDPLGAERWPRPPLGRAEGPAGPQVLGIPGVRGGGAPHGRSLEAGGYHSVVFFAGKETLLAYDLAARGWGCATARRWWPCTGLRGGVREGRRALMRHNAVLTAWLRRSPAVARCGAPAPSRRGRARTAGRRRAGRPPGPARCGRPAPGGAARAPPAAALGGGGGPTRGPGRAARSRCAARRRRTVAAEQEASVP